MSNVAKFLIVLNLILAAVFVGSAANYLGQKDYVQHGLEADKADLQSKLSKLQGEYNTLDGKNKELSAANSALTTKAGELDTARAGLKGQNDQLAAAHSALTEQHTHAMQALDALNNTLKAAQAQITTLSGERDAQVKKAEAEAEARTKAEAVLAQAKQQLDAETAAKNDAMALVAETNRKSQEQAAELEAWRAAYPDVSKGNAQAAIPPAKVLAADNTMDIVVISVGESSGVKRGNQYVLSRGNKYVATIKITDVQADKATGMVVKGMKQIAINPGDVVSNG